MVFVVDISASMKGSPLQNVKNALLASLFKLNQQDTFNVIAFNGEAYLFSPSMVTATKEAISKASKWVETTFIANGGTNIMLPLTQVILNFRYFQYHAPFFILHGLLIKASLAILVSLFKCKATVFAILVLDLFCCKSY